MPRTTMRRQVDILQHLGASLNVAYCYGAYEQAQCVGIVMELLSGGELWSRIRKGHYSEAGAPYKTQRSPYQTAIASSHMVVSCRVCSAAVQHANGRDHDVRLLSI